MPFECEVETDPGTEAALLELLRKKWLLEELQAQAEQEAFARSLGPVKAVDGIGEVKRAVHPFAFHDWALKLGSYGCWQDRGFLKYFERIAPEVKVDSLGTKTQVGYGSGARAKGATGVPAKAADAAKSPRIIQVTRRADVATRNVRESKSYGVI